MYTLVEEFYLLIFVLKTQINTCVEIYFVIIGFRCCDSVIKLRV